MGFVWALHSIGIWLTLCPSYRTTGEQCRYCSHCPQNFRRRESFCLLVLHLKTCMFCFLLTQCARRWFDEGQTSHLVNLGKYVSAMLAAGAKVAYEKEKTIGWLSLLVVMSSIATVYQLYWDFVKDWGLLQANSKNPWLRNELLLRRKFIYFLSMVNTSWCNKNVDLNLQGTDPIYAYIFKTDTIKRLHAHISHVFCLQAHAEQMNKKLYACFFNLKTKKCIYTVIYTSLATISLQQHYAFHYQKFIIDVLMDVKGGRLVICIESLGDCLNYTNGTTNCEVKFLSFLMMLPKLKKIFVNFAGFELCSKAGLATNRTSLQF